MILGIDQCIMLREKEKIIAGNILLDGIRDVSRIDDLIALHGNAQDGERLQAAQIYHPRNESDDSRRPEKNMQTASLLPLLLQCQKLVGCKRLLARVFNHSVTLF